MDLFVDFTQAHAVCMLYTFEGVCAHSASHMHADLAAVELQL